MAELVLRTLTAGRLVDPAFAWGEVGSVLRKKVRQGLLTPEQSEELSTRFGRLPIEFVDMPALRDRAWEVAVHYGMPTLYDAAFLACTEVSPGPEAAVRQLWAADQDFLRTLGAERPPYVRQLGVD